MAPKSWEEFWNTSQVERLNSATKYMDRQDIGPELYAFFKAEVFNRHHWDVTRNNMANALIGARGKGNKHPDPELHEVFILMLDDENEDLLWRDYCLQFLSETLSFTSDPERVKSVIAKHSKRDSSIAGTAMIHMAHQEQYGDTPLNDEFNRQLAEQLEKPDVHIETKMAIVCVMGKRRDIKRLPIIRKYAGQNDSAVLKRVAIAAIGTIAADPATRDAITSEDERLVKAALKHKNGAVCMAAESALKKLKSE